MANVVVSQLSDGPHIDMLGIHHDQAIDDTLDMIQQWASFESAITDVSGTDIPGVRIAFSSRDTAKEILTLLLSGSILPQLHRHLRKVQLMVTVEDIKLYSTLSSQDIDLAPTQVTVDDGTMSLSDAQRAEWLLSRSNWRHRDQWDKREEYVRGLVDAARAAAATADVGDQKGRSSADEVQGATSKPTQETAGEEEHGDEEDAGAKE